MMYSETNLPRVLGALHDLLDELSSEIDLHYEDDETSWHHPHHREDANGQ